MKFKFLYIAFFISSICFGQKIKSEEILIKNDSIELPGTLTYLKENTPLIIWVHGSGNVDRNGNQKPTINANYIKQFRDSINKEDIAFFSYDKRTATKRNFAFSKSMIFNGFVSDLKQVIHHFKNDRRFSKIILIGHSQGSLTAMLAAKNVDKYISLAGISAPLDDFIINEYQKASPVYGVIAKQHFEELNKTGAIKEVNPALAHLLAKPNQSFMKSWIAFNPSQEIKKLTIPVLIINGTKDLQVPIANAEALHKIVKGSELVLIKNMNHVLKIVNSQTENQQSYFTDKFPLSTELITTIVDFLKK
jgi:pimeloyl-ACP methyl ester carboxylesterase